MSRSLGRDHCNIHILGRYDAAEMNVEAVGEHQHVPGLKIRLDIILIQIRLLFIVDQDHNDIRLLRGLGGSIDLKALLYGLVPGP